MSSVCHQWSYNVSIAEIDHVTIFGVKQTKQFIGVKKILLGGEKSLLVNKENVWGLKKISFLPKQMFVGGQRIF